MLINYRANLNPIKSYFYDINKIFTSEFDTEKYYKPFEYSIIFSVILILFILRCTYLNESSIFFTIGLGSTILYVTNWLIQKYHNKTFNLTSVNMGSYGGFFGSCLALFFNHLINIALAR